MDVKEFWRNEKVAFLALASLQGVGFWTLHKIVEKGASFKETLKDPDSNGFSKYFQATDKASQQEQLWSKGLDLARELDSQNIRMYFRGEQAFPFKLKDIPDPPHWIFIQGSIKNLDMPTISIVGSRNASDDGVFLSRLIVAAVSELKCVTVSGLALGIDQICHTESIRYGIPTIAVLGTGVLNNYPKGSDKTRAEILAAGGSIVTEYLPNQSYSGENFVRRNRIQSALCDVLVPAEWRIKSGTAHTVGFAYKQKKLIINIFLPKTESSRPEIEFSREKYGALSFCVPQQTAELTSLIIQKLSLNTRSIKEDEPHPKPEENSQLNLI